MVWTTDPQGRVVGDSPTWREFTGQSYDEWKGEGWLDAVHPDDRDRALSAWKQAVEEKAIYTVDYRLRRQDGAYRWTTARGVPVLEEDGGIREWIGTNTDITERRRAEEERERFFAVGADLLVVVGYDGYFKEVGPACERTLGWTAAELKSEPWINFLHPDDREATLDLDGQVTQGREVLSFENRYRHKDGSYRWLDWKAKPYPQESLIFAGAIDVTDRKWPKTDCGRASGACGPTNCKRCWRRSPPSCGSPRPGVPPASPATGRRATFCDCRTRPISRCPPRTARSPFTSRS